MTTVETLKSPSMSPDPAVAILAANLFKSSIISAEPGLPLVLSSSGANYGSMLKSIIVEPE